MLTLRFGPTARLCIAAVLATVVAATIAAPAATAAARKDDMGLHAAFLAPPGGGVSGMVELQARSRNDRRPRVRALLTGADPGASIRLVASRRSCSALRRNPRAGVGVWSGKAGADGEAAVGLLTPARGILGADFDFDLGDVRTLGWIIHIQGGGSGVEACARATAGRALPSGSRPTLITGALTGDDGASAMVTLNLKPDGTVTGWTDYLGLDPEINLLLSMVSPGSCAQPSAFRLDLGDALPPMRGLHRVRGRLNRQARRAIATRSYDLALSPADGAGFLACGRGVKWEIAGGFDAHKNE